MFRAVLFALLLQPHLPAADAFALVNANVVDGTGAAPRRATVVIRDGVIESVSPGAPPAGVAVIDVQGRALLPGLFDLHTHLLASGVTGAAVDWGKNLKAYLVAGVTTVADMSTYPEQFEPLRKLIAGGLPAPRVLMAGRFSTPGGHGAEGGRGDFHTQLVQTPRQARAAVRRFAAYQPDLLKVFTDGWRYGLESDMTSMDEETLKALVEEAHQSKLKVVTHTVSVEKARLAARAGVDVINHGLGDARADAELLQLLKSARTGYVQTLAVYEPRTAAAKANPARMRRWLNLLSNGGSAQQAGVLLGSGTDAGMPGTPHGQSTLHELELMVSAGLTPLQAITAATANSARLLGLDRDRGTVEAGKLADLVLIDGDPASNIADIHKTARVWLGGREIDRPALTAAVQAPGLTPLTPVRAQPVLDDFESASGRSRIDTLWINNTDGGSDHSRMFYQRVERKPGNHAMAVFSEMSDKERPFASMQLPLTKGAVLPVDARAFRGVEFEARGQGPFLLRVNTRRFQFGAPFRAQSDWRKFRIPFDQLQPAGTAAGSAWTAEDLLAIEFQTARKSGEKSWLEIDNLRFYLK